MSERWCLNLLNREMKVNIKFSTKNKVVITCDKLSFNYYKLEKWINMILSSSTFDIHISS